MTQDPLFSEELAQRVIEYALYKSETEEYISLGFLVKFTVHVTGKQLTKKRLYNLRRWIERTLKKSGYFYTLKLNGLIYFTTTPAGRQRYIDLIRGRLAPRQNSNLIENTGFLSYRQKAEKIIYESKHLSEDEYDRLERLFNEYLYAIDAKVIILRHKERQDWFALVGYSTRFNSEKRRKKLLARYDHAWRYASKHYKEGVFLTLTTDPSNFSNIYEATLSISWAWNSFMSWLQKRLGFRPPYIKVLEFTKKGWPHLHVVLFKTGYLAKHEEITEEWNRLGQGIINYEYKIVNKNGSWTWKHPKYKPKNGGRSVMRYLKKYLLKTMSENALGTLALYWITNRRFYTTSRILGKRVIQLKLGEWEFWGAVWYNELFDYLPWWVEVFDFSQGDG